MWLIADELPEDLQGNNLEVPMAQHLLAAADMYQLTRLRRICERRLCESVDVETAATTMALAEQNHAEVSLKLSLLWAVSASDWCTCVLSTRSPPVSGDCLVAADSMIHNSPGVCPATAMKFVCVILLQELKRVCLDFVSRNLAAVMQTDGYRHMTRSCPNLQAELLQVIASTGPAGVPGAHDRHRPSGQHVRRLEDAAEERRVRQRREA